MSVHLVKGNDPILRDEALSALVSELLGDEPATHREHGIHRRSEPAGHSFVSVDHSLTKRSLIPDGGGADNSCRTPDDSEIPGRNAVRQVLRDRRRRAGGGRRASVGA